MIRISSSTAVVVSVSAATVVLVLMLSMQRFSSSSMESSGVEPTHRAHISSSKNFVQEKSSSNLSSSPNLTVKRVASTPEKEISKSDLAIAVASPGAAEYFRTLDNEEKQFVIEQLRKERLAYKVQEQQFDLDSAAAAIGLDVQDFTIEELNEINKLLLLGQFQEAAAIAKIDLASLTSAEISALTKALTISEHLPPSDSTIKIDPYTELREGSLASRNQELSEIEREAQNENYLNIVANMNSEHSFSGLNKSESVANPNAHDPYQQLRDSSDYRDVDDVMLRAQFYFEQATQTAQNARRN